MSSNPPPPAVFISAAEGFDCPICPVDVRFRSHAIPFGKVKLNRNQLSQRADGCASQIEHKAQRLVNGLHPFWVNDSLAR